MADLWKFLKEQGLALKSDAMELAKEDIHSHKDAHLLYEYALGQHYHCLYHCAKKIEDKLSHIEKCLQHKKEHEVQLEQKLKLLKAEHKKHPHSMICLKLMKLSALDLLKVQSKERFLNGLASALHQELEDTRRQMKMIPHCNKR